jgi:hypothetical protein
MGAVLTRHLLVAILAMADAAGLTGARSMTADG